MTKFPFRLIFAVALVLSFVSCDNEPLDDDFEFVQNNPNDPTNPFEPGEGSTGDYWPTAVGNIWVYETLNFDETTNENDYQIIGESTFEGLPAYELDEFFIDSQLDAFAVTTIELTGFLVKNEGDYIYYNPGFDITQEGAVTTLEPFSYVFFKDYLEAGESFAGSTNFNLLLSFDVPGFDPIEISTEINFVSTVVDRDFEMTINGETFQDVIHVSLAYSYSDTELNEEVSGVSEIYFAKDIGPIKIVDQSEQGYDSEILSYELN